MYNFVRICNFLRVTPESTCHIFNTRIQTCGTFVVFQTIFHKHVISLSELRMIPLGILLLNYQSSVLLLPTVKH